MQSQSTNQILLVPFLIAIASMEILNQCFWLECSGESGLAFVEFLWFNSWHFKWFIDLTHSKRNSFETTTTTTAARTQTHSDGHSIGHGFCVVSEWTLFNPTRTHMKTVRALSLSPLSLFLSHFPQWLVEFQIFACSPILRSHLFWCPNKIYITKEMKSFRCLLLFINSFFVCLRST